jgi:hypothetical protein
MNFFETYHMANCLLFCILVMGMTMAQYYVGACSPCQHGSSIRKCCVDHGYAGGFCQDGRFPLCFKRN